MSLQEGGFPAGQRIMHCLQIYQLGYNFTINQSTGGAFNETIGSDCTPRLSHSLSTLLLGRTPSGRHYSATKLAYLVVWLHSPTASDLTGSVSQSDRQTLGHPVSGEQSLSILLHYAYQKFLSFIHSFFIAPFGLFSILHLYPS